MIWLLEETDKGRMQAVFTIQNYKTIIQINFVIIITNPSR